MPGIRVAHSSLRSVCHVVPVLKKPFLDGGFMCPTCHVWHPVKAVHLWLDDRGECLVSEGVLGELRLAGMPDLSIVGDVAKPPPLQIGHEHDRSEVDRNNRAITEWRITHG